MSVRNFAVVLIFMSLISFLAGCPKKPVSKEELLLGKAEEMEAAAEREKAARLEAERALRDKELKAKEEAEKKALAEKELAEEREKAARLEAERALKEKELKAKEEEIKKLMVEKELEAERERTARLEAERAAREKALKAKEEASRKDLMGKDREFEKSLVAKRHPGIEGEVLESKLLKDVRFEFDKYDIRPGDAEVLKETAALLRKYPTVKIQIEGHCDERGTLEYNLALGQRRANSVRKYLTSLGVSEDRLSTISYGEERPLEPGSSEESWTRNRRAHFVILSR